MRMLMGKMAELFGNGNYQADPKMGAHSNFIENLFINKRASIFTNILFIIIIIIFIIIIIKLNCTILQKHLHTRTHIS